MIAYHQKSVWEFNQNVSYFVDMYVAYKDSRWDMMGKMDILTFLAIVIAQ